jgi:hypothetical protein
LRYSGTHVGDDVALNENDKCCIFDYCPVGIFVFQNPAEGQPQVHYCRFNGGQIGVKFQYSDPIILGSEFNNNTYEGIQTLYVSHYTIGGMTTS